jgi:hypothetical protein
MIFKFKILLNRILSDNERNQFTENLFQILFDDFSDCKIKIVERNTIVISRIPYIMLGQLLTFIEGFFWASFDCKIFVNQNRVEVKLNFIKYLFFLIPLGLVIMGFLKVSCSNCYYLQYLLVIIGLIIIFLFNLFLMINNIVKSIKYVLNII